MSSELFQRWALLCVGLLTLSLVQAQFPSNYKEQANLLIRTALENTHFDNFEYLCDTFGPRYRGTPNLENALDWIAGTMIAQGLAHVVKEPVVNITNWIRGEESLTLTSPRQAKMSILGLGNSVGGTVSADVIVVSSFDDLRDKGPLVKGKIVLYNVPFVSYGLTVVYRVQGASEAAKLGAVASLVRSITPYSLYTPHTGSQTYSPGVPQIPTAAVTIEDAELMSRMYARGQTVTVTLVMNARTADTTSSFNILAEIVGRESPQEVVVLGGHSDSWDVGQGAIDDGGGFFTAWDSARIINELISAGLLQRPRRTIRVVLWTDEEMSQMGAQTYALNHLSSLKDHVIAFESDSGNFEPVGFGFSGTDGARTIMMLIGNQLLASIGAGNITVGGADADNGYLGPYGVPLGSLKSDGFGINGYYFYFHHTDADTITHINRDGFRKSVAAFAVMTYVLADMEERLPWGNPSTCPLCT